MSNYYNKIALHYDSSHQSGFWKKLNEWELSFILPYCNKNTHLVEIGCGSGILLDSVRKKVSIALGFDSSEKMVELAREKGCSAFFWDIENPKGLPITDNFADVVFCYRVFPHLKQQEKALSEIARILKPDGLLFFDFYNSESPRWLTKKFNPTKTFTQYQTKKEVVALLPDNLFVIQIVEGGFLKSHVIIGVKKNA